MGNRLPDRIRTIVMDAIGLTTILIGAKMGLQSSNVILVLGSLIIGAVVGEVIGIEKALNAFGDRLERWVVRRIEPSRSDSGDGDMLPPLSYHGRFARGFVSASLLFCVGPMTIMGAIQDGLTGDYSTLAIKAVMDGVAAMAFASSLGIGVVFSVLVILVYQGGLTLMAVWAQGLLTDPMVREMTAAGGMIIFALGLGLLEIRRIRVANLLPAIFIAPLLVALIN